MKHIRPSCWASTSTEFISPQTVLGNVVTKQDIYKLYFVHEKFDIGYFVIREEAIPEDLQEYTQ